MLPPYQPFRGQSTLTVEDLVVITKTFGGLLVLLVVSTIALHLAVSVPPATLLAWIGERLAHHGL